jgi:predicted TIM-barrel fold metal-dependent hydrolase
MAREWMERRNVRAAVASIQPQVYWGDATLATRWARQANEYLAGIVRDDPEHFGGLASLPLPDTQAACRELEYAMDVLKLDGVSILTSQDGRYLGEPAFDELCQELNRRSAVVVVHPNTIPPGQEGIKHALPYSLVEFVFDTTRLVANLLYSGTLERYPSISFILPHAGGTVPYVAGRIAFGEQMVPRLRERVPKGVLTYLRRLYYDTALSSTPFALAALREFAPVSQIVFGSDYPMAPTQVSDPGIAVLEAHLASDDEARAAIFYDNAVRLFPRFDRAAGAASVLDTAGVQAGRL